MNLKTKLIGAVLALVAMVGIQATVVSQLASDAVDRTTQAQDVGVQGALLGNRIKFDVVQVQQWLTDISATRGLDGLNDGFDVAAEFAEDFNAATEDLEAIRPDLGPQLDELRSIFADYHGVGIEMAEAYVAEGPSGGNVMMGDFDAAAEAMGETVDALVVDLTAGATESLISATSSAATVQTVSVTASAVVGLLVVAVAALVGWSVMSQLRRLTEVSAEIAKGNLGVEVPPGHNNDALGRLTLAFQEMTESLRFMVGQVRSSSDELNRAAEDLTGVASALTDSADRTADEADASSVAGTEVSGRVAKVATGINQLDGSTRQVAVNVGEASQVAAEAVAVAERTSRTIEKLGDSSREIGSVIQVINEIAEQTNLLALNATIEAARAGESGKGFAVVANEVKVLATQTAQATEEISSRIQAIQTDTSVAVEANGQIGETIGRIATLSSCIAAAVDEQSATLAEIGQCSHEAVDIAEHIASIVSRLASTAGDTKRSTQHTQEAASAMSQMAESLHGAVDRYS